MTSTIESLAHTLASVAEDIRREGCASHNSHAIGEANRAFAAATSIIKREREASLDATHTEGDGDGAVNQPHTSRFLTLAVPVQE
jgi:hypothetical protein